MKSHPVPWFILPILALSLGACDKSAPATTTPTPGGPDEKVLFQTLENNGNAINRKDIDGVMATIHPQAPDFAGTREKVSQALAVVTLRVSRSNLKVLNSSPDEAQVRSTVKTERMDGDRSVGGSHVDEIDILRPDNGQWKIYTTEVVGQPVHDGPSLTPSGSPTTPPPAPAATPEPALKPETPAASPATPEPKAAPPAEKPPQ